MGLRRWAAVSRHGALQTVVSLLLSAFIVLTVVGIAFRGTGMRLTWPGG
jgi:hypothetical protein